MQGKYYCPKCLHVFESSNTASSIGCPRCGIKVDTRKHKVNFGEHDDVQEVVSSGGFTRRLIIAAITVGVVGGVIFVLDQLK
jgi:DNA-directed RNA polymerase subunit RPC12/RpoP